MIGLYHEERVIGSRPLSQDLAKHLYTRVMCGKVAIVSDKPVAMLSALRKQWVHIEQKVRHERSSTLNPSRLLELSHQIARIQTLKFTAKPLIDEPRADVQIATIEQFIEWAPQCRTLYITCAITTEQLYLITAWMPKGSLVVICKLATGSAN